MFFLNKQTVYSIINSVIILSIEEVFFLKLDGFKIVLVCLSVMFFTAM